MKKALSTVGQRRAEQKLRESEESLHTPINNLSDVILEFDMEGKFTYASPQAVTIFGYKSEEMIGLDVWKFIHPEDVSSVAEAMKKGVESGEILVVEFRNQHKDGHYIPVSVRTFAIKENEKIKYVGVMRDIDERKRAEVALRESEEKLRVMFESIGDGIIISDLEGNIIEVNEPLLHLLGCSNKKEIIGRSGLQFIAEQDRDRAIKDMMKAVEVGYGAPMQYTFVGKNGREFDGEASAGLLRDGSGNVVGFISIVRDITERKQAKEELRGSEEKLRSFMESATDFLTIWDSELNLVDLNEASLRYPLIRLPAGVKKEDFIGKNMLELEPHVKERGKYDQYLEVIKTGKPFFTEDIVPYPKHGDVHLEVRAFKVGDGLGIVTADITERKKAEEVLEHLNLVLRAIRNINQLITREKNSKRLIKGACNELVETRGYLNAWIALLDESGGLVTTAEAGLGKHFKPMVEMLKRGDLTDCTRRALNQSGVIIIEDPLSTCVDCPLAQMYGDRGAMTVRLEHDGNVYGFMSVSIPRDLAADEEEQAFFREVAGDIAFALHNIKLEEERKLAEEALQESEEFSTSLLDDSPTPILVIDPDTSVRYANHALEKLTGFSNTELINRKAPYPWWTEETSKDLEEAVSKGAERLEELFQKKNGERFWVEISSKPIRRHGELDYYLVNWVDITERKRAEEALQQREQDYLALLETTFEGIVVVDAETLKVVYGNRRASKMFGFDPVLKDGVGVNIFDFVHPEDKKVVIKGFTEDLYQEERRQKYEVRAKTKDGKELWITARGTRTEFQGRLAVLLSIIDITERKKAEEELRESEEKLRIMFESIRDGITVYDLEGQITEMNGAALRLHGFSNREEVIGQNGLMLVAEKDRARARENTKRTFKEGRSSTVQYTLLTKGGKEFEAEHGGALVRDGSGKAVGFIGMTRDITKRKRAEEALRESEEKLRVMFESTSEGIVVTDLKGKIIDVNDAILRMSGLSREELVGQDGLALMPREDTKKIIGHGTKALESGTGTEKMIEEITPTSGKAHDIGLSMGVLRDSSGDPTGFVAIARDITERKKAEEALRESEEKYRTVLEDIEDGYFEVDIAGNFTFFNDPMCGIIGYSRDEMMGMNNRQYMDKKNAKKVYQAFNRIYATGKSSKEFGWEVTRKDGTKRAIETSVSLKRNSEGEPVGFRGIIRDITEHKSAEEALRKSEEHYRLLAENVTDVIWTMDNNMQFTYISPSVTRQRGYSVEEAMALGMDKSLTPASLEVAAKAVLQGLSEEEMGQKDLSKTWTVELEMYCKDGSTIWTEMEATFLRDPDGQSVGILGVARDITERKQAEEELKETMADLERSNAELEQFAYVASHDLQEPLRMVSSFTQLLAQRYKGKLDADADDFITFAVDGANRMQRLINDLLTYSRVGTRGKTLQTTYCEAVIDQSLDNLKLAIENCGAVITHDPLPSVMADESQLVQLFQNLIDNAIKFRGDQPPRVHVGVESKDGEWVFSVRDNGIGIDPEHFDRVFVIFQRLHSKGEYAGTGMGLATCKKIVERHAGRIWVESKPGKGATFYFTMLNKGGKE